MAKSLIKKRKAKENPLDQFLNIGVALCNRHKLEYKGDLSLWFALISYNKYRHSSLKEYIEKMKDYDRRINNHKRIAEIEKLEIEGLTEKELLDYGEKKYKEVWCQLTKEVDLELKKY